MLRLESDLVSHSLPFYYFYLSSFFSFLAYIIYVYLQDVIKRELEKTKFNSDWELEMRDLFHEVRIRFLFSPLFSFLLSCTLLLYLPLLI